MATITTRAGKGAPLSWSEADANFINLNTYKVEQDISGNATITGDVYLTGSGKRITGDFSNATVANRVMFQTSTENASTVVSAIPSGTGTQANFNLYNKSDPANASDLCLLVNASEARIQTNITGAATYLPMTFHTGGSERMRIDTSGNVGIGASSDLGIGGTGRVQIAGEGSTQTWTARYSNDAGGPVYKLLKSRGTTVGSNGLVVDGDAVGAISFDVANGSTYNQTAEIQVQVEGTTSATSTPSRMIFKTTQVGSLAIIERMRINSSGNVLVTSPAGLGYGTGSGGTVTQATSKSTAVTLNKPTGQITMNNAALAAGATVGFTLANSTLGGADVLVATSSFSSAGSYRIEVRKVVSGSADIYVTNLTGGSLSDAMIINFAIIKGATA